MPIFRSFSASIFLIVTTILVLSVPTASRAAGQDVEIADGDTTLLGRLELADGKALADGKTLDGGVVLITHGTLAHHRMELVVALQTALAERGVNSLAHTLSLGVDRRTGMYDCAQPFDATYENTIREIGLWRDWLVAGGAKSIVTLGHSRGAGEATAAALAGGEEVVGSVLVAPNASRSTGGSRQRRVDSYTNRFGGDLKALMARAKALISRGKGDEMIDVPGFVSCPDTKASARSIVSFYGDFPERHVRAQLAALKVPALIVAAANDQVVGNLASKLADVVDGRKVRLQVVEDADHMFLDFFADDAAELVANFANEQFAANLAPSAGETGETVESDWPIIDLDVTEVLPGYVYSAIGETLPPSYENAGHNNNLSFIITGDGVVVVNGGGSNILARSLHAKIKAMTDQPVKYVIIENGQGHAFLGTSYWAAQGVPVIAQAVAHDEIVEHGYLIVDSATAMLKDRIQDTEVHEPDIVFEENYEINLGGKRIIALTFGPAHAAGDTSVWLPDDSLILTGDMGFHQRLMAIFPETVTKSWIESFEKMEALEPKYVIPGHGSPTTIDVVSKWTKGYLVYMRGEIKKILDNDGGLMDAYKIDQSAYAHLDTFDELAVKNASRIYAEMEFEFF